ncbi:helix-turn-helix domain-containing protein [Pseudonocardia sp. HH130630-07]|uniref:helix-turn-helix domain-containing protein n=1 Tax=Pseudonocardia sp. HH130630-07 TaxID=1690815 RepID=UPI000814C923|nr:helix-turn-helix domain-containing protein [Pseudonocardia sp. HH130630-07]ANY09159.1 hypothetical protein AFB00_26185 [Pseudonocardia sp. HH130630-07]
MSGYRELPPTGAAAGLVECAWQGWSDHPGSRRVLPDGCMDLLLHDGRLTVAGPDTAAHLASGPAGALTTGLRFRPGALPALLGTPAAALRDLRVPLSDVLPGALPGDLVGALEATACTVGDAGAPGPGAPRLLLAVAAALWRSGARHPLPAPLPRPALRALARGASAADLAEDLGVTSRTLHRHCLATLGYGPSTARRILRFRTASALLFDGIAPAEVAARAGYADQPHLSREVRALTGASPATLYAAPPPR